MKSKCQYCDNYIDDTQQVCPSCGAPNPGYKRTSSGTPRTIEELQQWYVDHNLPDPEVTRFFIGVDHKGARAFGIYRQGDRFIVYKNKGDGSRAIRYDGGDEAYAVNEIYLKLKETIAEQKANQKGRRAPASQKKKGGNLWALILVVMLVLSMCSFFGGSRYKKGYYSYGGQQYYCLDDSWYVYNGGWNPTSVSSDFSSNAGDYFESYYYNSDYHTSDFSNTDYYAEWEASRENSDSDWDSSWDSGDSWDSDFGSWDSDW